MIQSLTKQTTIYFVVIVMYATRKVVLFSIKKSLQWVQNYSTWTKISSCHLPKGAKGPAILATNVIKSYFEKGLIEDARVLFDEMPERDVVMWTAMIAGYTSCNHHVHAWAVFCEMVNERVNANAFTLSNVLKACKSMQRLAYGGLVHGLAIKFGLEDSLYVSNALMDMYATCCVSMEDACSVFKDMKEKNMVTWTTLITGYTHKGDGYGGLRVFREMLRGEAELNPHSFSIAVSACAMIGSHTSGKQIFAAVIKNGLRSNLAVNNSILDMYSRCGFLSEANEYFHEIAEKDVITWNCLIAGYERVDSIESFNLFSQMQLEGFSPNCFTFTSITAACANLAILYCGQQVHGGIVHKGLQGNSVLANALIDMYAKCGSIADSQKVFSEMSDRTLVSWTSMMIGYGAHGYGKEAVEMFDEMVISGIIPDRIVFVAVLTACSHAGLIDEGLRLFESMNNYNIIPDQEIYGCVVDLLGRAGRVEEAYQLIKSMPFKPNESVWGALLGACKAHKITNLGKLAASKVMDFRPNKVGAYVLLSNIYAAEGKWGEFAKLRKLMKRIAGRKEAGRSWIEVRNQVYSFVVGHKVGSHREWVYGVLELLILHMKESGYMPDLDCLIHDAEDGT